MKFKGLLFVFFNLASFTLGESDNDKIVGGEEAVPHSYPFTAAITLEGLCCCGGSILDETHIVTAAHCVEGYNWFEVITGAHNPFEMEDTQQRQIVQVSAATVHESYNPFTIDNDIAILKLNPPLEFNDYVQPIKEAQMEPPVRDIVTAIGWGMVADDLPGNVDNLREVDVPVLSDTIAEEIYAGIDFTTKICIDSSDGKGVCSGDSGGPLIDDSSTLVGIASFVSSAGCESGIPHCFTAVPSFLDWIAANMG